MSQSQLNDLKYKLAERLCINELVGRESEIVDIIDSSYTMLNDFDELRSYMVAANRSIDIVDDVNVTIEDKHYVLVIAHSCYISPFISQVAIDLHFKDENGDQRFVSHANESVEYDDVI